MTLAGIWAAIKGIFGAGDVAAATIEGAAADNQAKKDLDASAANVAEADRIADGAGVSRTAGPDEDTPPASPAARRPQ